MEMSQSILKNADLKSTKKRCLLLSILQTEDRAMTAEELLEKATPILPMNASTVYRTLNTLTEKGVLSKSLRKDGKSYFSLEKHDHHHRLVCTVCRKVIPVDSCPLKELEEDLEASIRGIFIRKQRKLKSSSDKGFQLSYFTEILFGMFSSEDSRRTSP